MERTEVNLKAKMRKADLYDKGLCIDQCGRKRNEDKSRCETCAKKTAASTKRWKARVKYSRHRDWRTQISVN